MSGSLKECKKCGESFYAHGGKGVLCPDCIDALNLRGRVNDDVTVQMRNARIKDGFYNRETDDV